MATEPNRRKFLETAAVATAAFTIVPRHVLGGPSYVAPSDKINLAYIGVGTEGLREIFPLLASQDIQITAVCDPCQYAGEYRDWSRDGLLKSIRKAIGKDDWGSDAVIPGGREAGKSVVEGWYAKNKPNGVYKGVTAYADYREMFEKEKDLNAVKIMTPDHLHGVIAIAAMKKGKHVITHKPIANRLKEAQLVIETAKQTGVATYLMPWDAAGNMEPVLAWIRDGQIGTLREVHNWSNRPVWPQYATIPTDTPPVPQGFDWDLWLGPEANRPYHPNYTHMVFRGWYDFGGGSMADMGHYSLWTVFNALELTSPTSIQPMYTHNCMFVGNVSRTIKNDFSFPIASCVRFKYPARGQRPAIDLIWYDGGMRPPTPEELDEDHKELPLEGMMFVGDRGKILAGFNVEEPHLIPQKRMNGQTTQKAPRERNDYELSPGLKQWVSACRGTKQTQGTFLQAGPITEAVNLYGVALRSRQRVLYDAQNVKVTNSAEADKYLSREYRKGWDPAAG